MIDILSQVVEIIGLGGTVFAHHAAAAPWGLHFGTTNQARFHIVCEGSGWLRLDGTNELVELKTGDVIFLAHGTGHIVSDKVATPATEITTLNGIYEETTTSVWGGTGPITRIVCGGYSFDTNLHYPFLRSLPLLIHLPFSDKPGRDDLHRLAFLLAKEVEKSQSFSRIIINRLVDVLLVYLLRTWLEQASTTQGGWFGALRDRQLGQVLVLMHEEPSYAWTVTMLAKKVDLSRSTLARRFTSAIGEPPMSYLKRWRMTTAAKMLQDSEQSLASIATQIGYESEFAFAKAFRQFYTEPPGRYRLRVRAIRLR